MATNHLKNLRIADLEIFITAAQLKNLGRSAQLHHLSQSAASTAVSRVESAFGVSLCRHERRQFRLTPEGELFLPRMERWVAQMRELTQSARPIRIVTTHAIAQIAVPALLDFIEYQQKRPDEAYRAVLRDEADLAIVLDNSPWKGVVATEIGKGCFQLYAKKKKFPMKPILLPEDQMEVLNFLQRWEQMHGGAVPIKTRIPSWSLIASICANSTEIGYLPDFLARKHKLYPLSHQPSPSPFRLLAIYRPLGDVFQSRIDALLSQLQSAF